MKIIKWLKKKLGLKKRPKPEDVDIDFLIEEFDTLTERIEYTFSDIDFTTIREYLAKCPKRANIPEKEMSKKLKAFMEDKK